MRDTQVDQIHANAFFPGVRYSVLVTLPNAPSTLCDLIVLKSDNEILTTVRIKLWDENMVPPVSQNYFKLDDADVLNLDDLLATYQATPFPAQTPLRNQVCTCFRLIS